MSSEAIKDKGMLKKRGLLGDKRAKKHPAIRGLADKRGEEEADKESKGFVWRRIQMGGR